MEKQQAPTGDKQKIQKYYNYKIKKYLARDCRKPKTKSEL